MNNFRRRSTRLACMKVRMITSRCRAIGNSDRVSKMNLRPGCLGHYSCLPCTGAVHGCDQSQSPLNRSTDRLAETRTAPFLDLCALLEGECDSPSVAPTFLFRERRTEYRNNCEGTHLGEGRCAYIDTHLARNYAYTCMCHDEGASTCVSDFHFVYFSRTHAHCVRTYAREAQIDNYTSLLHRQSDGSQFVSQCMQTYVKHWLLCAG